MWHFYQPTKQYRSRETKKKIENGKENMRKHHQICVSSSSRNVYGKKAFLMVIKRAFDCNDDVEVSTIIVNYFHVLQKKKSEKWNVKKTRKN